MQNQIDKTQVQRIAENTELEISTIEPILKDLLSGLTEAFEISQDFEDEVMAIVVTESSQIADMDRAAEFQKKLGKMRIHVEKERKRVKSEYLEKGRNIDKIAGFLQGLINPLEDHAKNQAMYFELKAAHEAKDAREAAEKAAVEKRLEDERLERVENERVRQENEGLRKKNEKIEKKARDDREKSEKARLALKKKHDDAIAKLARSENEKAEKLKKEKKEFQDKLDAMIKCPKCGHEFTPEMN